MIMCFIILFIFQSLFSQSEKYADSLYVLGRYNEYIESSKRTLMMNPELRHNYRMVIRLAESSLQKGKYDLATKIFYKAKDIDTTLNDYIDYKQLSIYLLKKDTNRFLRKVDNFLQSYPNFILNKKLVRLSYKITAEYRYYQKLKSYLSSSSISHLEAKRFRQKQKLTYDEIWSFLRSYKYHEYSKQLLDSIEIDSNLTSDQLYTLFDIALIHNQQDYYDPLFQMYDRFKKNDVDRFKYVKYLEKKNRLSDIIKLVENTRATKRSNKIYFSRLLPRTYLKLGNSKKGYAAYLQFARKFPNHSFALSAITYVLEKYSLRNNLKSFNRVIDEFSLQKSKYANFYKFYRVVDQYEKGKKSQALTSIKKQRSTINDNYSKDRLDYWEAKILLELKQEKKAYSILKRMSIRTFENYYTAKATIALIENKLEVNIPNADSLLTIYHEDDHNDHLIGDQLEKILLVDDVFGRDLARKEIGRLKLSNFDTIEDMQHLLLVYEKLELYHLAFIIRKKLQYKIKAPSNTIWDRIKLGFPDYYSDEIEERAKQFNLENELVSAIMYRESLFQHDVVSAADAHGLLQIIPATAENISPKIGINYKSVFDLYNPETNISIGTYYLNRLLRNYKNHYEYVLAAYNAGPGRVNRWMKRYPITNADLFIEKIGIEQTRTYIKKVLYHYYMYKLLNGETENIYYSGIRSR